MLDDARGPSPVLVASALKSSAEDELAMVDSLLLRAGFMAEDRDQLKVIVNKPEIGSQNWYYIVPAGFNYIDERCNVYMRALYDLDRNRDRVKSGLLVLDKSSNAIMGVAGASSKAMQIAAQSFGMTSGLSDAFVDRYMFKVEPTIVFLTLDKLRTKYREAIAARKDTVKSPGEAMVILRNYLNICQPQFIEATVNRYVALGEAESNDVTGGRTGVSGSARSRSTIALELAGRQRELTRVYKAGPLVAGSAESNKAAELEKKIQELENEQPRQRSSSGVTDASGVRVFLGPR